MIASKRNYGQTNRCRPIKAATKRGHGLEYWRGVYLQIYIAWQIKQQQQRLRELLREKKEIFYYVNYIVQR